ncbi:MAG: ABC transporter substrate-binding protein, partial [Dehalococcoidia bacterium]|nr:ABC transporter substrate-binding protein [Dehalococcoidia bacterium]
MRDDVVFSNSGRKVTAADFKWSMERAANPRTQSPTADTYLGDIVGIRDILAGRAQSASGIRVVDDYTLQLTIDEPRFYFLAKLTYPTAFVVDEQNVTRGGRTWADRPNGTGPFRLREYRRGQSIILDRNEQFYGGVPTLQTAVFILSGGQAITMYENNEIDVTGFGVLDADRILDPR